MSLSFLNACRGRSSSGGHAYITREAVSSSRIEGTQASVTEVFDAAATGEAKRDDIREVRSYIAALEHGVRRMEEDGFPISLRLAGCRRAGSS
jgi:hypothetical protein